MPVSVEMLGNGTGAEPGVEVETIVVTENWVKRTSEASGLTFRFPRPFRWRKDVGSAFEMHRCSRQKLGDEQNRLSTARGWPVHQIRGFKLRFTHLCNVVTQNFLPVTDLICSSYSFRNKTGCTGQKQKKLMT